MGSAKVLPALRRNGRYEMPGKATSRRAALPDDLPPEALSLRPAMRQRLWRDALDTARLEGNGLDVALEWFGKLCRLMAAQPPAPDNRTQMVRDFLIIYFIFKHILLAQNRPESDADGSEVTESLSVICSSSDLI